MIQLPGRSQWNHSRVPPSKSGWNVFPYEEEHMLSNDLGALQAAVAGLQAQLRKRDPTKK